MHKSWERSGTIIRRLRPFLFIFRPRVFPGIIKATTYPVNVAQKRLFSRLKNLMETPDLRKASPPAIPYYWTEVIAIFDRCTAVAYTGSMKVVPKALGTLFWFGVAVHAGLLPCLNPAIVKAPDDETDDQNVKVNPPHWPIDTKTSRPLQGSTRTHEVTFKSRFVEVCPVPFRLNATITGATAPPRAFLPAWR
jgi:hypothetical protein